MKIAAAGQAVADLPHRITHKGFSLLQKQGIF
jgi:hypothetical protein